MALDFGNGDCLLLMVAGLAVLLAAIRIYRMGWYSGHLAALSELQEATGEHPTAGTGEGTQADTIRRTTRKVRVMW